MDLLFKITTGEPEDKASIKDTTFKDHYPSVNRNFAWSSLKPFIRQATREYILPYLGEEMYGALADDYQAGTLGSEQAEVVELLQDCIAYYTIVDCLPIHNIDHISACVLICAQLGVARVFFRQHIINEIEAS